MPGGARNSSVKRSHPTARAYLYRKAFDRVTQPLSIATISFTPVGAIRRVRHRDGVPKLLPQPGKMDAHERPGSTDAALDGILQQLRALRARMADERLAEQASFENQMSAFQNGKDMRETRRKAIQRTVESLSLIHI